MQTPLFPLHIPGASQTGDDTLPPILTSVFELFTIGPGPSSSHTIGPMEAGLDFRRELEALAQETLSQAHGLQVHLFGSLSATGRGHGTVGAVIAGLLGYGPASCPSDLLLDLNRNEQAVHAVQIGSQTIPVRHADILFDAVHHGFPFSNTLLFRLRNGNALLLEHEYYSIGGGFIRRKGRPESERGAPAYPYRTMTQLKRRLRESGKTLDQLLLANEAAISGLGEQAIWDGLDAILQAMLEAVERGLTTRSVLPGLGLHRKAPDVQARSLALSQEPDRSLAQLASYAFAASEENAAGGRVVTAPTSGASGVIPAVCSYLFRHVGVDRKTLGRGLLAAASIGFLAKQNASISGAEVGCQGEVGVASAMAAALLAHVAGRPIQLIENAAEIALEHHLGLTCDPVGGYVQIPCIERNAMGAVKAYAAQTIASAVNPLHHLVGLDQAIRAMWETGRDMSAKYKETSQGGLALSLVEC